MAFYSCSPTFTLFTWIWAFLGISILPVVIWAFVKQIRAINQTDTAPWMLSKSTIAFYITTIFTSSTTMLYKLGWCTDPIIPLPADPSSHGIFSISRKIFGSFWVLQSFFLMVILFARIYYAFRGSVFAVSKCVTAISVILTSLHLILLIVHVIAAILDDLGPMWVLTFSVLFWDMAINATYLTVVFIYKLYQVNKVSIAMKTQPYASKTSKSNGSGSISKPDNMVNNNKLVNDEIFVSIMTKSAILTISSVSVTSVMTLITMYFDLVGSEVQDMIWHFFILMDIFTNFACVTLSAQFANKYYLKICGFMDNGCRKCCTKLSAPNQLQLSSYIESNKTTNSDSNPNSEAEITEI